mmetsp:Transcript_32848/g.59518  ORF Transcript_32848/g.59518 Transcript_32848/m.59518 type:complete len:357 (-) Transcript_32848:144-1214(-)|eukprot:CAMPEP_0175080350 /NCGR_PEP_ID=MMETSP0052_2-20121109/25447_1 /TAXON_ID=51329 ORGANISM="Polytomella parva, Strain SAG 63-3" /NCGR_SAMPLE_ID=MMETSP0052_2 /ASSEMBLY_ACC=CAM_ASM_000194 /LENGTH=356 /DNA_ID=CAMNT_0016351017 /DNA_START=207 /DNA_END=1277 /DNA_ORIENTATION=-
MASYEKLLSSDEDENHRGLSKYDRDSNYSRKHDRGAEVDNKSGRGRHHDKDKSRDRKRHKHSKGSKHHKSYSSGSDSDSTDDEMVRAAKRYLRDYLKGKLLDGSKPKDASPSPPPLPPPPPPQVPLEMIKEKLSEKDFFLKSNEFSHWLIESQNKFLADLATAEARSLFLRFVSLWNSGCLEDVYYKGQRHAPPQQRTSFQWNITGVKKDSSNQDLAPAERRRRAKAFLDEFVPKEDCGRERRIEEKKGSRMVQRTALDDEGGMGGFIPGSGHRVGRGGAEDDGLLGGPGIEDSFEAARAREKKRLEFQRQRMSEKQAVTAAKVSEYRAAEDAKLEHFRSLVAARGAFQIPKRDPL